MPSQNTLWITWEHHNVDEDSECWQHIEEMCDGHLQKLAVVFLCDDELVNVFLPAISKNIIML